MHGRRYDRVGNVDLPPPQELSKANPSAVCLDVNLQGVKLMGFSVRMVIRIMLMIPVYGISSLISLFSLNAAFVIDAIRDIYEVRLSLFGDRS